MRWEEVSYEIFDYESKYLKFFIKFNYIIGTNIQQMVFDFIAYSIDNAPSSCSL